MDDVGKPVDCRGCCEEQGGAAHQPARGVVVAAGGLVPEPVALVDDYEPVRRWQGPAARGFVGRNPDAHTEPGGGPFPLRGDCGGHQAGGAPSETCQRCGQRDPGLARAWWLRDQRAAVEFHRCQRAPAAAHLVGAEPCGECRP